MDRIPKWISGLLVATFVWELTSCHVQTSNAAKSCRPKRDKPHIIMILADDMGWNDVSFHGSNEIPTPNIDALAYNGVILNNHYTAAMCTPSRAALLTGKYPTRLGMQHYVLIPDEPRGLPIDQKLLPEYFQDAGYKTHAIGKWHLGFYKTKYTPTNRGFDTFYGYWNGYHDYYDHFLRTEGGFVGLDMWSNLTANWNADGKYSTDLFTKEAVKLINTHDQNTPMFMYLSHLATHTGNFNDLQAPAEETEKYSYIKNDRRRIYAAMMSKLDRSIGDIIEALHRRDMLKNSIIIFMSDNGAPTASHEHSNTGSNYPLRGNKESPWEGGIRGAAAIWSPFIKKSKRVSNSLMYIADWFPTLLSASGLNLQTFGRIDGVDMWPTLRSDQPSLRPEILINIDPISNYSAIRHGDYKYISGSTGSLNGWYGQTEEKDVPAYNPDYVINSKAGKAFDEYIAVQHATKETHCKNTEKSLMSPLTVKEISEIRRKAQLTCNVKEENKVPCNPLESPCLFNIKEDPCEMVNIAAKNKLILEVLKYFIVKHGFDTKCPSNVAGSERVNPKYWNNTWAPWQDESPRDGGPEELATLLFDSVDGTIPLYSIACSKIIENSINRGL